MQNKELQVTALLLDNGFVRQSGSDSLSNDFPKYYHKAIEFIYDYEIYCGEWRVKSGASVNSTLHSQHSTLK